MWAGFSLAIGITIIAVALYSGGPPPVLLTAYPGIKVWDAKRRQAGAAAMSASVGVYVATALFLVFGGDTEEEPCARTCGGRLGCVSSNVIGRMHLQNVPGR